jgi:endonuclease III
VSIPLAHIVGQLEQYYGTPMVPSRDPFELIVLENIAYLANDTQREKTFAELKARVGINPENILKANRKTLAGIAKAGILPDVSVEKLITVAQIAYQEFDSDLSAVLRLPIPKAKKALKKFPGIGDPGAEKILLFAGVLPVLALESNGMRVLLRLGFGREDKNYSITYRSAQTAASQGLALDCEWLTRAHQLLRQHGKELCKTAKPKCAACPLRKDCQYFKSTHAD